MRTIVISDVHGHLSELQSLLHQISYNSYRDKLIFLGDYMDRGKENKRMIAFLKKLKFENSNIIFLKGNHDDNFVNAIQGKMGEEDLYLWVIKNGGYATLMDYTDYREHDNIEELITYIRDNHQEDVEFLSDLPLYYEDDRHIYVHAGIDPVKIDWKNSNENDFLFIRDRFIYHDLKDTDKVVIFGHTPCHRIKNHLKSEPFFDYRNNRLIKIGIDGGMGANKQLNALIIQDDDYICKDLKYEEFSIW